MRSAVASVTLLAAGLLMALALLAAATVQPTPRDRVSSAPTFSGTDPGGGIEGTIGSPSPSPSNRGSAGTDAVAPWWMLAALTALGGGVAAGLWRRRGASRVLTAEAEAPGAGEVIAEATAMLESGRPVDAVTRCWRELERLGRGFGIERRPSETADEFAGRLATALHLPREPSIRLCELFERGWYAPADSTPLDVTEARACLIDLLAAARRGR